MNVGIIGADGFIAKNLVKCLQKDDSISLSLFVREVKPFHETNFFKIDFNNLNNSSFRGIDLMYFMVSETIPASSWDNPKKEIDLNLIPFLNFLDKAVSSEVKKVVFISSAGTIYGHSSIKVNEDYEKKPYSPYGIIKLTMENYLNYYKTKFNLNYDIFRTSNVYGSGQNISKGLGVINTFLHQIISSNKIEVFGDGMIVRNYIYIDDVVELLKISLTDLNQSRIFNLSSHDEVSLNELIKLIRNVVNNNFEVIYKPNRKSDVPFILLDNTKILSYYKDYQFTSLLDGIKLTYMSLL
jgi:UDP-glucose 4-epimerase